MENNGEIRRKRDHERDAPDLEPVRIQERGTARSTIIIRAVVAALAAFAGAMATASIGNGPIEAGQWWAAIAAGTVALGGVIGVPDKHLDTLAPRGEIQTMRNENER